MTSSKFDRGEPELAGLIFTLCMHVGGFVAVEAREEKSIGSRDPLDSWHSELRLSP
jgi:hypothetical protein